MKKYDTTIESVAEKGRKQSTIDKLIRMNKVMNHEEPDRIPISDFFCWHSFTERWRKDLGLDEDANLYYHYDMDWIPVNPNLDPWIRSFEMVKETQDEVVVNTGFGATMRKKFSRPMPEPVAWDVDAFEKLEKIEFDDPYDKRRFFEAGDNHLAGVNDVFERNSPAWIDTIKTLRKDFPVYGGMLECSECLTRLIGQENMMMWMGLYPDRMGKVINRIGEFYLECTKASIKAGNGLLDGIVLWGDIAYKQGLFFSPDYWRQYFKPWAKAMIKVAHTNGLPVIYHGCGNMKAVMEDLIEIELDLLNPLEVKAGMDAVELRRQYGHKIGFCGGSDTQLWERGDKDEIRREVLRILNAAKGGGFIFQSDHSVPYSVSGHTYDYIYKLVKEYGTYPLDLGEFDEDI